jgi:phosphotransferase system HPr (HPr) family protein
MEVKNRLGLHLRSASTLAQAMAKFDAAVTISRGKNQANAKSVTSLMMLGAACGTKLKVKAEGADARRALDAVRQLFEQRFGEE